MLAATSLTLCFFPLSSLLPPRSQVFLELDVASAQATNKNDLQIILAEIERDKGVKAMNHELKDALVTSAVAEVRRSGLCFEAGWHHVEGGWLHRSMGFLAMPSLPSLHPLAAACRCPRMPSGPLSSARRWTGRRSCCTCMGVSMRLSRWAWHTWKNSWECACASEGLFA